MEKKYDFLFVRGCISQHPTVNLDGGGVSIASCTRPGPWPSPATTASMIIHTLPADLSGRPYLPPILGVSV